jgi:ribosome-binding ATPase YchF (GTP1/OBG family)
MKKKRQMTDKSNNLEDEMARLMAEEMQKEIDGEIMCQLLADEGWHKVKLYTMLHETGKEIDKWTVANTKGGYWTQGIIWMFKEEKDANWFKLRWLQKEII